MSRQFWVGGVFKLLPGSPLVDAFNKADLDPNTEAVVAPLFVYIIPLQGTIRSDVKIGAHNCRKPEASGALAGEISPEHLSDIGISYVILGHSDRRIILKEDAQLVADTTGAAIAKGLKVVLCIVKPTDETIDDALEAQLNPVLTQQPAVDWKKIVLAYQPVGLASNLTPEQIQADHLSIRTFVNSKVSPEAGSKIQIVFGGNVDAAKISTTGQKDDVDGFLVEGVPLIGATPNFVDFINAKNNGTVVSARN